MRSNLHIARLAFESLSKSEQRELISSFDAAQSPCPTKSPKIVHRKQFAEWAGCTERTVDLWAAQGLIEKVKLVGRKKALGFRESDVTRLLEGRNHE